MAVVVLLLLLVVCNVLFMGFVKYYRRLHWRIIWLC